VLLPKAHAVVVMLAPELPPQHNAQVYMQVLLQHFCCCAELSNLQESGVTC
jgi:hypothetical protein